MHTGEIDDEAFAAGVFEAGCDGAGGTGSASGEGAEAQDANRKIGYCVIGLGRIADHFIGGVQGSSTSKITGLVSGHRDKAEQFAARLGVPKSSIYSYEDMDRMRDNKSIDAVYVALPNSMHAEYTIRSAKAGKHVLCEKPMSTTVSDAEDMIAACKAANVKLMIAYRLHYEPTNLRAIELIRQGALGKVQAIESANGFNENRGRMAIEQGAERRRTADGCRHLLPERHALSDRRGAGELYGVGIDDRP